MCSSECASRNSTLAICIVYWITDTRDEVEARQRWQGKIINRKTRRVKLDMEVNEDGAAADNKDIGKGSEETKYGSGKAEEIYR